jgi:hypothetical protein
MAERNPDGFWVAATLALASGLAPANSHGAVNPRVEPGIRTGIENAIKSAAGNDFKGLIDRWSSAPSASQFQELLTIARDATRPERTRYIAWMGATAQAVRAGTERTELEAALPQMARDSSWVIRSATLESLEQLGPTTLTRGELARIPLRLLEDPALVVRSRAVDTVIRLRPPGTQNALVAAALHPANHHGGKALWVPQKALRGLADLPRTAETQTLAEKLAPLLASGRDPALASLVREAARPGASRTSAHP